MWPQVIESKADLFSLVPNQKCFSSLIGNEKKNLKSNYRSNKWLLVVMRTDSRTRLRTEKHGTVKIEAEEERSQK